MDTPPEAVEAVPREAVGGGPGRKGDLVKLSRHVNADVHLLEVGEVLHRHFDLAVGCAAEDPVAPVGEAEGNADEVDLLLQHLWLTPDH